MLGFNSNKFGKEEVIGVLRARIPKQVAGGLSDCLIAMRSKGLSPFFITIRPDLLRIVCAAVVQDWNPDFTPERAVDSAECVFEKAKAQKKFLGCVLLLDYNGRDVQPGEAKLSNMELTKAYVVSYEPG
jgi:hypothetical protein